MYLLFFERRSFFLLFIVYYLLHINFVLENPKQINNGVFDSPSHPKLHLCLPLTGWKHSLSHWLSMVADQSGPRPRVVEGVRTGSGGESEMHDP